MAPSEVLKTVEHPSFPVLLHMIFLSIVVSRLRGAAAGAEEASSWAAAFSPVFLYDALALLASVAPARSGGPRAARRAALGTKLAAEILLALKLDGTLELPWTAVLGPLCALLVGMSVALVVSITRSARSARAARPRHPPAAS